MGGADDNFYLRLWFVKLLVTCIEMLKSKLLILSKSFKKKNLSPMKTAKYFTPFPTGRGVQNT